MRKPRRDPGQLALAMEPPPPPPRASAALPPLPRGEVRAEFVEMGPAEFADLVGRSDAMTKEAETKVIAEFARTMRENSFDPNGDSFILGPDDAILDGLKRAKACISTRTDADPGVTLRLLVIRGVPEEARFSMDDTLGGGHAPAPPPAAAPPPAPAAPHPDPASACAGALAIRDAVSAALGHRVLPHLTAAALAPSAAFVHGLAARGFREDVSILLHAVLREAAPLHADAFLRAWCGGRRNDRSAPARLGRPRPEAILEFLRTAAVAAESFVEGREADPHALRSASRRTDGQLLRVLFGRPGRDGPDRLLSCKLETFDPDAIAALLERAGHGIGGWSPEELARIEPLVRDIHKDRGLALTGQTVKIDDAGGLIDGVDRLAACLLAGRAFKGFVVRGFRPGFDHRRTQGRKGSIGHRLYADGYTNPYDIQAVLGNVHRVTLRDRTLRPTNTRLRRLHSKHPQVQRTVMFVHPLKEYAPISVVGTAHLLMTRFSRDLADQFMAELLVVMRGGKSKEPTRDAVLRMLAPHLNALRPGPRKSDANEDPDAAEEPELERGKGTDRKASDRTARYDHALCMTIQAMNAWCREELLPEFSPLPDTGYARLMTPPQVKEMQARLAQARDDDRGLHGEVDGGLAA